MTDSERRLMDAVGKFVKDVGFPVVVTLILLFGVDRKMDRILAALDRQTNLLEMARTR